MKSKIYTSAAGDGITGFAYLVTEDVLMTGKTVMHYSGCTSASLQTAQAMAILQALYWIRENKQEDYVIYSPQPDVCYKSSLASRINDMHPKGSILQPEENDTSYEICVTMAEKALEKMIHQPNLTFADAEIGDPVMKKASLFSQSYVVMLKSIATRTIMLKNLTTVSKRQEIFTQQEFDEGNFIRM